jgi:hypothetical protein
MSYFYVFLSDDGGWRLSRMERKKQEGSNYPACSVVVPFGVMLHRYTYIT